MRGELRPASEVDTYGYLLSGSEGPADPPQKSPRKPHPMMI